MNKIFIERLLKFIFSVKERRSSPPIIEIGSLVRRLMIVDVFQ